MKRISFWSGQVAAPEYGPGRAADLDRAGLYRGEGGCWHAVVPGVSTTAGNRQ